jgi:queuosine precursor transporter
VDFSWASELYKQTYSHPEYVLPVGAAIMAGLFFWKKPSAAIYVGLIPLVNWSFANVPTVTMPDGGEWAPFSVVTGLILVVRDFAQREVSHRIFLYMALGLFLSSLTTPPQIVIASGVAFLISETTDWAIFTFTKRPLSKRILWSASASSPLDTLVFLFGANMVVPGTLAWSSALTSIASKLIGAVFVWFVLNRREQAALAQRTSGPA